MGGGEEMKEETREGGQVERSLGRRDEERGEKLVGHVF